MTINVHNLLHLPEVVRQLGPLWAHSCFPFESANGDLLKLFHGSQSVEKQVCKDYIGNELNYVALIYIRSSDTSVSSTSFHHMLIKL